MTLTLKRYLLLFCAVLLTACVNNEPTYEHPLYEQSSSEFPVTHFESFAQYQATVREWLTENRVFIKDEKQTELQYNTPFELSPPTKTPPTKGIILVHGLGDSPWSFIDIAQAFAADGYLVRSLLLPGHGSRPADLLSTDISDWEITVSNQVEIMKSEGLAVSLAGFSTGANLVTVYANNDPSIKALYLFSPAFKSDNDMDFLAPAGALFVDWIFQADPQNYTNQVKYDSVPLNAFAQYYWSSYAVQKSLKAKPFDRPAFLAVTQDDSVVDVGEVVSLFENRFTNANSKFIWFGNTLETQDKRVVKLNSYLPERKISNFSHMSLLYREQNPYYGINGQYRMCRNSTAEIDYETCVNTKHTWYSAWGYKEEGKVFARLTYNPYFNEMLNYARAISVN